MTMDSSVAFTSDISDYQQSVPMSRGSTSAFDPDRDSNQPELPLSDFRSLSVRVVASRNFPKGISGEFSSPLTGSWNLAGSIDRWSRFDAELADNAKQPRGVYRVYRSSSPLTESLDLAVPIDLWSRRAAELADRVKQVWEACQAYRSRIEALRSDAELDGFAVNEASERDFWAFVKLDLLVRKAEVVLVDNGNLRAVWDGEDGSHLGLQFLGNRTLQYVIFRRREGSSHLSRVAGRDTFGGVKQQVRTFELEALLQV